MAQARPSTDAQPGLPEQPMTYKPADRSMQIESGRRHIDEKVTSLPSATIPAGRHCAPHWRVAHTVALSGPRGRRQTARGPKRDPLQVLGRSRRAVVAARMTWCFDGPVSGRAEFKAAAGPCDRGDQPAPVPARTGSRATSGATQTCAGVAGGSAHRAGG